MERCAGQHGSPRAFFRALWVALRPVGSGPCGSESQQGQSSRPDVRPPSWALVGGSDVRQVCSPHGRENIPRPRWPSCPQLQGLCTADCATVFRKTRLAFLLPPKAPQPKADFSVPVDRPAWGLQTLAYLALKEREVLSRGSQPWLRRCEASSSFKLLLMTFVRKTTCLERPSGNL